MKVVLFCHSMLSDWNNGNAHFLRGVAFELMTRGHVVRIYEPRNGWSLQNLMKDQGVRPVFQFQKAYPGLDSLLYDPRTLDLDKALEGADLVLAHEWNEPDLIAKLNRHRARPGSSYRLLFHDTRHRSLTDPKSMGRFELSHFDGVLAFGRAVRDIYLREGWAKRVWIWHEAADTRVFKPLVRTDEEGDLVWVGNGGDEERTKELKAFLFEPVKELGLKATVFGVGYPDEAKALLKKAGIRYGGWLANYKVPAAFSRFQVTVHIPRRPYADRLPGIPTIRVFEAMACGIPLVCSPWEDAEHLFTPGQDYLVAPDKAAMKEHLKRLLREPTLGRELTKHALRTIRARHTCAHRVDELLKIGEELHVTGCEAGGNLALQGAS